MVYLTKQSAARAVLVKACCLGLSCCLLRYVFLSLGHRCVLPVLVSVATQRSSASDFSQFACGCRLRGRCIQCALPKRGTALFSALQGMNFGNKFQPSDLVKADDKMFVVAYPSFNPRGASEGSMLIQRRLQPLCVFPVKIIVWLHAVLAALHATVRNRSSTLNPRAQLADKH
jgi:hypothetical protein